MRAYGTYFPGIRGSVADSINNQPQVIPSPNTAPTQADANAIVARVAHVILQGELDWSKSDVFKSNPSLNGLSKAQIENAIREALA